MNRRLRISDSQASLPLALVLLSAGTLAACSDGATGPGEGSGGSSTSVVDGEGTGGRASKDPLGSGGASGGSASGGISTGGGPGGTVSTTPLTIEEDSTAHCGYLGAFETTNGGYEGSGYFNGTNRAGAGISWVVDVAEAGDYELTFRYAHGASDERGGQLWVAHERTQTIEFPATGSWTSWSTASLTVSLGSGAQHLTLSASESSGLPNIDSLTLAGLAPVSAAPSAGDCDSYSPGAGVSYASPSFGNVSVHDPSVLKVDSTYYVFGSHLAAAKTTNLRQWTSVASDGVNASNPLFDNVVTELADAFSWSTVVGLWAADVLQLESTGKYLMYYNSCKGNEAVSALGIASSTNVEGPYEDEGIIVRSGFYYHGQTNPDGTANNTAVDPNAIDPDTFYDADGDLWMVYGSYSGGIFILEMDAATGFPVARANSAYYGKHLLGGGHAPIEGPYIQYSPESGYYYLFTSYGGLLSTDGYNMRVARSRNPDGPYVDMNGTDQATVNASGDITQSGVKIVGNHQWAGTSLGYVSAGHNSAHYDPATGRHFLIFHSRFPGKGETHEVRVHEMWVNLDGWLVVSPQRYAPRTNSSGLSDAVVDYVGRTEVPGTYQMVNHGRDMSGTIKQSGTVTLAAGGAVTGALSGTWTFGGNGVVLLSVDGKDFSGVLRRQYSELTGGFTVTLTALDAAGETLWGVRTGS